MICPRCEDCEKLLKGWIDKQNHDKCWYYPDIFEMICTKLNIDISTFKNHLDIKESEFESGCKKFRKELFELIR